MTENEQLTVKDVLQKALQVLYNHNQSLEEFIHKTRVFDERINQLFTAYNHGVYVDWLCSLTSDKDSYIEINLMDNHDPLIRNSIKFRSLHITHKQEGKKEDIYRVIVPLDIVNTNTMARFIYLDVIPELEKLLDLKILSGNNYQIDIKKKNK